LFIGEKIIIVKKSIFILIILLCFLLLTSIASAQLSKFIPLDIISNFFNSILRIFGVTSTPVTPVTKEKDISSSGSIVYSCDSTCKAKRYTSGTCRAGTSTNTNLAVIPDDWLGSDHWGGVGWDAFSNVVWDYTVERTSGIPSIKSMPHTSADANTDRQCECKWYAVKPGDHIVAKCWIKIDANGDTDTYSGARIGMDLSGGNNYLLWGIQEGKYVNPPDTTLEAQQYVHWGTPGWTQRTVDFIVPNDYFTYDYRSKQTISPTQVDHIVLWLQVWSSTYYGTEVGNAWFADAELYINPPCLSGETSIGQDGCSSGQMCCCS
jgi:hypothetical protein